MDAVCFRRVAESCSTTIVSLFSPHKTMKFLWICFFLTFLLPRLGALPSTDFTGVAPAILRTDYELFLNPASLGAFELARNLSFLFQLSVQSFSAFLTSSASQLTSIWLKRQNRDCYSDFLCTFPHFDLVTIATKEISRKLDSWDFFVQMVNIRRAPETPMLPILFYTGELEKNVVIEV